MATQVPNVNNIKSGLCPHGLPPAACPICSNMGGGGSLRAGERPQKAGEMSYHQCVIIGQLLEMQRLAAKNRVKNHELQIQNLKLFENNMAKISANLKAFIANFTNSSNIFARPLVFIAQNLALPTISFLQIIPKIFLNVSNIKIDIQDKLSAVFGEVKNFIEKKISDLVSVIKSKLEGLFKIFKKDNSDNNDTKIDDDKKIFNLKILLKKIIRKKKKKNDESGSQNKQ